MREVRRMRRLADVDYVADAVTAAKRLLGKWLCRRLDDGTVRKARIVETEAYCGEDDTACHAHCGKTMRNAPMYETGGCRNRFAVERPVGLVQAFRHFPRSALARPLEEEWS